MADFISDLKRKYQRGSMVMKLIFINIAVFLLLRVAAIIFTFAGADVNSLLSWIECPANVSTLLARPWTLITYMFAQFDILHILFNVLWLYWFGSIFLLRGNAKQMFALYIYGGLMGAVAFIASYNLFPYFAGVEGWLIGSSASVIAIVVATAMRNPDYKVNLLLLGPVSLKWIAVVTIVIDFLSITDSNAGGHIAHLGGAIAGFFFASMLSRGIDITKPFNRAIDSIVDLCRQLKSSTKKRSGKSFAKQSESYRRNDASSETKDNDTLNDILDKIKKSGYSSLTAEEKKRLFDVSRRIKN